MHDGQPPAARARSRWPNGELRNGRSAQSLVDQARTELYRGQCNCSYWHGAFGGIYLPHLRNAVYQPPDRGRQPARRSGRRGSRGDDRGSRLTADDYNFDGRQEVRLANDRLVALVAPAAAGSCTSSTSASICHNLLATLTRRARGVSPTRFAPANRPRAATSPASTTAWSSSRRPRPAAAVRPPPAQEPASITSTPLDATLGGGRRRRVRRARRFRPRRLRSQAAPQPDRMQVQLIREGQCRRAADPASPRASRSKPATTTLEIAYLLEGLPPDEHAALRRRVQLRRPALRRRRPLLPRRRAASGSASSARSSTSRRRRSWAWSTNGWASTSISTIDRPSCIWTFPIETVSQSEGGFELVHQSVVVQPHWFVEADAEGRWSVQIRLSIGTAAADQRRRSTEKIGVGV